MADGGRVFGRLRWAPGRACLESDGVVELASGPAILASAGSIESCWGGRGFPVIPRSSSACGGCLVVQE